jgi:hypothetical protein
MTKKILIIAFLFVTASAFSQVRKPVFMVPDSTTAYGVTMPANSLVFDYGANRLWTLTSNVLATDNVSTSSKILITEPGAGGGSDLATTLGLGNTSGASDISLDDGQILKATNGDGLLNLRAGATNGSVELKGSTGVYNQGGVFGLSGASFMNLNPLSISFGLFNQTFTKAGQMVVVDTDLNPFNTNASPTFPTSFSSQGWTINSGVFNTSVISGANGIAKTSNIAYTNKIGFNSGGSFETRLSHTVATSDNDILLPDNSGTVSLLDIYTTDGTLSGNRVVTMAANNLTFSGTGQFILNNNDINTLVLGNGTTKGGIIFNSGNGATGSTIYDRNDGTHNNGITLRSRDNIFEFIGTSGGTPEAIAKIGALENVRGIAGDDFIKLTIKGSPSPNDVADGINFQTADNLNVFQDRFVLESDSSTPKAYFNNISGLAIGTTSVSSMLTVSGDVETTGAGNGLIVEDGIDGNRYRIFTENGVLFTELVP